MKNRYLTLLFCLGILLFSQQSNAQCPGCTINLPGGIPADTIVVDSLPPAYKNAYYEEQMSYRLPYTTNPLVAVAPPGTNVPANLNIEHFKILSVTNLPPGLTWIGDRTAPMIYNENAPQTRDGCITLCGTPGASGTFIVNVNLELRIQGFNFPSPPLPLTFIVLPDTNASFVLDTAAGCAPFGAVITNLVPSNGNPNFHYFWDFSNGTTSTDENPDTVWYNFGLNRDTTVAIHQQVIIDTFPYLLQSIVVASDPGNSCNDDIVIPFLPPVLGAPDLYIILTGNGNTINTDPNFALIGNTQNNQYPRDTMTFPGPIELPIGQNFTLEVWDDDSALSLIDNDDPCGSGTFNFSAALGAGTHTLTSGTMTVEITITHYVDTVTYTDSVRVSYCNVPINYIQQVERSLSVFPNPTSDLVNIRFQMNGLTENVELSVSDLLGRTVYTENVENFTGEYNREVNLENQSDGVYILQLRVGKDILHKKIVKN